MATRPGFLAKHGKKMFELDLSVIPSFKEAWIKLNIAGMTDCFGITLRTRTRYIGSIFEDEWEYVFSDRSTIKITSSESRYFIDSGDGSYETIKIKAFELLIGEKNGHKQGS